MQVAGPLWHTTTPDPWRRALSHGAGLAGGVLLTAALIFWVAANWMHIGPNDRLGWVRGVLVLSVLAAAVEAWRGGRWAGPLVGLAALSTGALLALVSQIYQTGADRWQLFALWAVLILPWLLLMRTVFLTLLWAVLLNIALMLYAPHGSAVVGFSLWTAQGWGQALVLLNLALLALAEALGPWLRDPRRMAPRLLAAAVVGWMLWSGLMWIDGRSLSSFFVLVSLLVLGGMYWVYVHRRRDLSVVMVVFVGGIGLVVEWTLQFLDAAADPLTRLPLLILLIFGLSLLAFRRLATLWREDQAARPGMSRPDGADAADAAREPWYFWVLRATSLIPVALLLAVWVLMLSLDTQPPFVASGLSCMAIGVLLDRLCERRWLRDTGLVLVVFGLILFMISTLLGLEGDWDEGLLTWVLLLLGGVLYGAARHSVLRFAVAWLLLTTEVLLHWDDVDMALVLWIGLSGTVVCWLWSLRPGRPQAARPLAWALILVASPIALQLTSDAGFPDGFIISPQGSHPWLLCAAMPGLLLAALSFLNPRLPLWLRWGPPLALLLIGWGWLGAPALPVALTWILLGSIIRHDRLRLWGVLLGIAGLFSYYMAGEPTLLFKAKALALAGTGLLLGAGVLAARMSRARGRVWPAWRQAWRTPAGALAGGLLVLGVAQAHIHGYESLRSQGREIVLLLAPADPRSLLQGDYMALDYTVRREAMAWLDRHQDVSMDLWAGGTGWLVLREDASGVWQLARVAATPPPDALPEDEAVLHVTTQGGRLHMAGGSWFFPEGRGAHYRKAMYGVLRVGKDGKALLTRLLDERRQPL